MEMMDGIGGHSALRSCGLYRIRRRIATCRRHPTNASAMIAKKPPTV
jgi:hypothetical protein